MRTDLLIAGVLGVCGMASFATPVSVTGGPSYPGGRALPEHVLDEDRDTYWAGDPKAESWELRFDLGRAIDLAAVTIDYFSPRYMASETTVDVSVDGITWQALGALPPSDPARIDIGMTVRYVRIGFEGKAHDKQPAIITVAFGDPREAGLVADVTACEYLCSADDTMQPARAFLPVSEKPVPLVVGLHTWSGDYRQEYLAEVEKWCVAHQWAYIHPNFRGPNWTFEATGSDLVVQDIVSAVDFVREQVRIDASRIYLVGASGGGYTALLMAGRRPDLWAGVSAWVPISDLTAWYRQCKARGLGYAAHIVKSVGGVPGSSEAVDARLAHRSPVTWLSGARDVPLDINAGIHDGHKGSVPVSHSLVAFNCVAHPEDRLSDEEIGVITSSQCIPAHLQDPDLSDASYGAKAVLFRRVSGHARVTIFEGGHEIVQDAALQWLASQRRAR